MPNVAERTMIPVAKPYLGIEEADATRRPILSGWVTQGPEVAAFENEFAAYTGSNHACAVSNCTTALHLALRGVGVGVGDEVITVSHSFIATANAVRYLGAIPVFVDIDLDTYNMDPALISAAVSRRTKAILVVHQVGQPADVQAILNIASEMGLPVIEDAACAAGSEIRIDGTWEKIGRPLGRIACFSFHPRKVITTGDGGMLTTNDPELDQKFRLWRQHGMNVSDTARHASDKVIFEEYVEVGYNYRMTDIQAAVGREQLKKLDWLVGERRRLARKYHELLATIDGIILPSEPLWSRTNWQSYMIRLEDPTRQVQVMQSMLDDRVATRRGVMNTHLEPAYASEPWRGDGLVNSELAQDSAIVLPLYVPMAEDDQVRVAESLKRALTRG